MILQRNLSIDNEWLEEQIAEKLSTPQFFS